MNILCVEQFSNLGGGQLNLVGLLPAFRERGWGVRVALPADGPLAARIRRLHTPIDILPSGSYANGRKTLLDAARYTREIPKLRRTIDRLLVDHKIDLMYVNGPRLLPAASLAAHRRSVPLIFHCHHRITQPAAVLATGHALRISRARVVACCHFAAEPLRPYVGADSLSVLYNGVAPLAAIGKVVVSRPRRIGVIGRIDPEKGQMEFIRAAHLLIHKFPDCRFVLVGAPSFSDCAYFDSVVRASDGLPVHFMGWRNDIVDVFSSLDLLVVPSTPIDAAPRVIVEAFAARVPVIAFASGGIPEIVENGVTGFLTDAGTPEALAKRVADVMTMPLDDLRSVTDAAFESWRTKHTLDAYQRQVSDLLVHGRLSFQKPFPIGIPQDVNR